MSQRYQTCGHCGAGGWHIGRPHDMANGRPCRASGQKTEREIARQLARTFRCNPASIATEHAAELMAIYAAAGA